LPWPEFRCAFVVFPPRVAPRRSSPNKTQTRNSVMAAKKKATKKAKKAKKATKKKAKK
jgi:hypothetical protein